MAQHGELKRSDMVMHRPCIWSVPERPLSRGSGPQHTELVANRRLKKCKRRDRKKRRNAKSKTPPEQGFQMWSVIKDSKPLTLWSPNQMRYRAALNHRGVF